MINCKNFSYFYVGEIDHFDWIKEIQEIRSPDQYLTQSVRAAINFRWSSAWRSIAVFFHKKDSTLPIRWWNLYFTFACVLSARDQKRAWHFISINANFVSILYIKSVDVQQLMCDKKNEETKTVI